MANDNEHDEAKVLFASYYTHEYHDAAMRLQRSCTLFELDLILVSMDSQGSWVRNCSRKPIFLAEVFHRYLCDGDYRAVVWVDADAEVKQYPQWIFDHAHDTGYAVARHMRDGKELLSGTLMFWNNLRSRNLLEAWGRACLNDPLVWDQRKLHQVLHRYPHVFKSLDLPATYVQIFDTMRDAGEPVILHHQASRQLRRVVNQGAPHQ